MLRVTKRIEYGVLALLYLSGQENQVASVREISESCGIPETLLSKIMQSMKGVGFVSAVYGNQGGYRLSQDLSQINLLDLTQVLDGPIQVAECLDPSNQTCPVKENCQLVSPMTALNQKIIALFQTTSLQSLAPNQKGLRT